MAAPKPNNKIPAYPAIPGAIQRYAVGSEDDTIASGVAGALADTNLDKFIIADGKFRSDLISRITAADITRTIYGASTFEVRVEDWDRMVLNSRFVRAHSKATVDGHDFVLVGIKKQGDILTLVFEDATIAALRKKKGAKKGRRAVMTRAQFAEKLVKEIKGLKFYSPEKAVRQPIEPREVTEDGTTGGNNSGATIGGGRREDWIIDLFNMPNILIPITSRNKDAGVAWILAEGTSAKWNPLATTMSRPGHEDNFNGVGVRNYDSRAVGLDATADTLDQTNFAYILNAFKNPSLSALQVCERIDGKHRGAGEAAWGTGAAERTLVTVQNGRAAAYDGQIPGSEAAASLLMPSMPSLRRPVIDGVPVASPTTPPPAPAYPSPTPDNEPPRDNQPQNTRGFPRGATFTINGVEANRRQKDNTETAINQGLAMRVRKKLLVAAVCAGMTRTAMTYKPGDITPDDEITNQMGILQISTNTWTEGNPRSVSASFTMFYTRARRIIQNAESVLAHPSERYMGPAEICQKVIGGPYDARGENYAKDYKEHEYEARRAVNLFLNGDEDDDGTLDADQDAAEAVQYVPYEFSRGTEDDPNEDSWTCLQRLAEEVNWRCFVVDKTVYFVQDSRLLKNRAIDTVHEFEEGVDTINFDYDTGKPVASLTIDCRATRWGVPPGSVIKIEDLGPATGKYICTDIQRSLFSAAAEITLASPEPQLKEPAEQQATAADTASGLGADFDSARGTARVLAWALQKVPHPPDPSTYSQTAGGSGHHDRSNSIANLQYMHDHPDAPPPYDCSSFVCWAWAQVMVYVGSTTGPQVQRAKEVEGVLYGGGVSGRGTSHDTPPGGWQAGDLVWPSSGHVMMATGNGREVVEAANSSRGIVISPNKIPDHPYFWARWSARIPVAWQ